MKNPCNNCFVKGNCSNECDDYKKFVTLMVEILSITSLLGTALIIGACGLFFQIAIFPFWFGSVILCHIIPTISIQTNFFEVAMMAPFILTIYLSAKITKRYVLRPIDYKRE